MRQHLIHNAKQGLDAIEQGASWLTLANPSAEDIVKLIPPCNVAGIILVIEGNPELALNTLVDEIRVSGVCITANDGDPREIREKLGPHAIIGYSASNAEEIINLQALDIDYFTLPVDAMTDALSDVETPIVAKNSTETPNGFSAHLC